VGYRIDFFEARVWEKVASNYPSGGIFGKGCLTFGNGCIDIWARNNNLQLNKSKTKEIIFAQSKIGRTYANDAPTILNIARVTSINMLGVLLIIIFLCYLMSKI